MIRCPKCNRVWPSVHYFKVKEQCIDCDREEGIVREPAEEPTGPAGKAKRLSLVRVLIGLFTFNIIAVIIVLILFFLMFLAFLGGAKVLTIQPVEVPIFTDYHDEVSAWANLPESEGPVAVLGRQHGMTLYVKGGPGNPASYILFAEVFFALGLGLWFSFTIRKILLNIKQGFPFIEENSRKIKLLAWIVLSGAITSFIWSIIKGNIFFKLAAQAPGNQFMMLAEGTDPLLWSLVIFVLAQVVAYGVKLQREQDLTV